MIRLVGTDASNAPINSGILIKVIGDYKPGRVHFSVTDLTVPVAGMPITIGRTYDSLDRGRVGDFGNGWTLDLGSPRLTVNQGHDVTLTQPNGQRVTFGFTPYAPSGYFPFLDVPNYTAEPGVYGSLKANTCTLITQSGGQFFCFPGFTYQPTSYTYTDPYGRVFVYAFSIDPVTQKQTSSLVSITDLNHNTLTFSADGIRSNVTSKAFVQFTRDALGRITSITDTRGKLYQYTYDSVAVGDLDSVVLPQVPVSVTQVANPVIQYHYWPGHFFKDAVTPLNQQAVLAEYDADGRLQKQTQYGQDATVTYVTTYAYDLVNHVTTQTNPDSGVEVTTTNAYGDLLSQVQQKPDGTILHKTTYDYWPNTHNVQDVTTAIDSTTSEVTSYVYDAQGNRTQVINNGTDNANKTVMQVSYNAYSGPQTITNGNGTVWTVGYDLSTYMPLQVTDQLNGPTAPPSLVGGYSWNTHGSPLTKTDGNGKVTTYGYADDFGNLTSMTTPIDGARTATTTYQYDEMGRQTQVIDANNHITNYTYDDLGNVLSVENVRGSDQSSSFTHYEYDLNGNKTAMIDPRGLRTTYGYDYANHLTKITYSDGTFTAYTYDFRGNKLTETDQAGHVTTNQYDLAGQLLSMTRVGDANTPSATSSSQYDLAGRKTLDIDPNQNMTTYHYNHLGQMDHINAPENRITSNVYDDAGQLTDSYDGKNIRTHYVYDIRGRVTDTYYDYDNRAAHPNPVHQEYDGAGHVIKRVDQNLKATFYVYFDNGQLRTVTQNLTLPDSTMHSIGTNYAYDDVGNLLSITDAKSQQTSFVYDELNRQIRKNFADRTFELFRYDTAGNLVDHALPLENGIYTDPHFLQNTNHYTYATNSNRLMAVDYFDGQHVGYTYTANGLRQTVTDSHGVTTYGYDALDEVTSVTSPGPQGYQVVNYTYDANGNRTSMTSPAGTTGYDYNGANQLKDVKNASGSSIASYQYDANGLRTNLAYINGVSVDYGYNTLNQLTSIVQHKGPQQPIGSYAYTLDNVGNRTSVTEADNSVINWTYDDLYRLISETRIAGSGTNGTTTPTPGAISSPTFVPATNTPGAAPSATPTQTGTPIAGGNTNPPLLDHHLPI